MTFLDLALRLGAALIAGLALGFERELRGHPAGLRTHVLVSVGAALFTLAGAYGFRDLERSVNVDPARIAAQVASGIGFIGAGAILRVGPSIKGLTTAATLWLAASVGVAAGAGDFALMSVATIAVLLVLVGIPYIRPSRWARKEQLTVVLVFQRSTTNHVGAVLAQLRSPSTRVGDISVTDDKDRKESRVTIDVEVPRTLKREALIERLSGIAGVKDMSIGSSDEGQ